MIPDDAKNKKGSLLERIPQESDPVEKWIEWSFELKERCERLISGEKKRITQLRKLRRELKKKNKIFAHYKKEKEEYENIIRKYESCIFIRILTLIKKHIKRIIN